MRNIFIHRLSSSISKPPLRQPVIKQTQHMNILRVTKPHTRLTRWRRFPSPEEIKTHAQNLLHALVGRPQARKRQGFFLVFHTHGWRPWSPRWQSPLRHWTLVPGKRISPLDSSTSTFLHGALLHCHHWLIKRQRIRSIWIWSPSWNPFCYIAQHVLGRNLSAKFSRCCCSWWRAETTSFWFNWTRDTTIRVSTRRRQGFLVHGILIKGQPSRTNAWIVRTLFLYRRWCWSMLHE